MSTPTYDHALVMTARDFAVQVLAGKMFDNHPYEAFLDATVRVLMRMKADSSTLAAAYLHVTRRDCPQVTHTVLHSRFGAEIAGVVESCTGRGITRSSRLADEVRKASMSPAAGRIRMAGQYCQMQQSCGEMNLNELKQLAHEFQLFRDTFFKLDKNIATELEAMAALQQELLTGQYALVI